METIEKKEEIEKIIEENVSKIFDNYINSNNNNTNINDVNIIDNEDNTNVNLKENVPDNTDEINGENTVDTVSTDTTTSESVNLNLENSSTTNCLALTIQKDHKIVAVKNVFFRTIRMSWKVIVTSVTLALIKLFSS